MPALMKSWDGAAGMGEKGRKKREGLLRECPAYTLLYQFSPKDTGQSKVK